MGTATGGTLETGIYHQISHTNYEKASGTGKLQGTMSFDATTNTFKISSIDDGVTKPPSGGTYAIAGNKLTLNFTCPATASATFDFTYAAPTFTLYNYGAKHVVGFTKQ